MTFLNIMLLGGLAAAAIPLIIHLLNRRRFRVVHWGAMRFLDDILRTNRKRIRLEQLILLLVRMGIPALLAMCMARPVLTGMQTLLRRAPGSRALLLDNSFSMEAGDPLRSNYSIAREEAARVLRSLPRGSEAAVVGMAGSLGGLESPGYDLAGMARSVEEAPGGFGLARVAASMQTAGGLFASRMHEADREIVIFSDFQRASWGAPLASERRRAADELAAQPVPPRLVLFRVGRETRDNVAVDSLELSRSLVGIGQPVMVRATLRNHGTRPYADLRVHFRADGVEREASQITLGAGESGQLLFTHKFDQAGSHVLEVAADADALKADNIARASVPVLDRLPVLLVSGDRNPEPLRAETAFLEIALQPMVRHNARLSDLISSRTVGEDEFRPELLQDVKVVVLANVRRLPDDRVAALRSFVRDGGGLLIFPGERAETAWYNAQAAADLPLVPGKLSALAGSADPDAAAVSVVAQHYAHPALRLFNDPRHGSLGGAQIRAWYRIEAQEGPGAGGDRTIAARLDSGDPFLVESRLGEGRIVLCAAPCDADWSNLPLRPFYLPLMQELVAHLASQVYPPRNVEVGGRLSAFVPAAEAGGRAVFTDPEGGAHEAPVVSRGNRGVVEFAGTDRPGLYTMKSPAGSSVHFVVRTPRAESDLAAEDDAALKTMAQDLKATVVRSWDEYREMDRERRFGREIWRFLLWWVLILMFTEPILARWFARRAV